MICFARTTVIDSRNIGAVRRLFCFSFALEYGLFNSLDLWFWLDFGTGVLKSGLCFPWNVMEKFSNHWWSKLIWIESMELIQVDEIVLQSKIITLFCYNYIVSDYGEKNAILASHVIVSLKRKWLDLRCLSPLSCMTLKLLPMTWKALFIKIKKLHFYVQSCELTQVYILVSHHDS